MLHAALSLTCTDAKGVIGKRKFEVYLRKIDGPRTVTLPDGQTLSQADLPEPECTRWVASRKAVLVKAVEFGLIDIATALQRYGLSKEEFDEWRNAFIANGETGLRVTKR